MVQTCEFLLSMIMGEQGGRVYCVAWGNSPFVPKLKHGENRQNVRETTYLSFTNFYGKIPQRSSTTC